MTEPQPAPHYQQPPQPAPHYQQPPQPAPQDQQVPHYQQPAQAAPHYQQVSDEQRRIWDTKASAAWASASHGSSPACSSR